ncbi:MAG: hypothetical protein ACRC7O_01490 [Fimbriiglobus sp.]
MSEYVVCAIDDGYTLTETIPAGAKYGGLSITYRPATASQVRAYIQKPGDTPDKWIDKAAALIDAHVVAWNCGDQNGKLDKSEGNARRLAYPVVEWMCDVVCGYIGSGKIEDARKN